MSTKVDFGTERVKLLGSYTQVLLLYSLNYHLNTYLFSSQNLSISQAKWLSISPGLILVPQTGQPGACVEEDLRLTGVMAKQTKKLLIHV